MRLKLPSDLGKTEITPNHFYESIVLGVKLWNDITEDFDQIQHISHYQIISRRNVVFQ